MHRAGKHDAAAKLLADQSGLRARLARALVEHARGRRAEAGQALAQAGGEPTAERPWDERLELDLLKPSPARAPAGK